MRDSFSRRGFLAAAIVSGAVTACHTKATRYYGWLFIASADEKAIIVADLASFKTSGSIPLGSAPNWVLEAKGRLFAVCADGGSVVSINPLERTIRWTTNVPGTISAASLTRDGNYVAVATNRHELVLVDAASGKITRRTDVPGVATAMDVAASQAAILLQDAARSRLVRVAIPDGKLLGTTEIGSGVAGALQYRIDSQTLFVAASEARQIVSIDATNGVILARTPVPIRPARFCASSDGGQVFVTGANQEEQLVVFSPFQNEIEQTIYAGRALTGMAVAQNRNVLFLAAADGDVSLLDIGTFHSLGFVRTGGHPRDVLIAGAVGAQLEEYAFVVDSTGDVSVLHIQAVLQRTTTAFIANPPRPVFTVFRGGGSPQSAVIVPYTA